MREFFRYRSACGHSAKSATRDVYCAALRIKHKGLHQFAATGTGKGINPALAGKLERVLSRLDMATEPGDLSDPGFRLHRLRGKFAGHWSIRVTANWRVVFRFEGREAVDVDLIDYH